MQIFIVLSVALAVAAGAAVEGGKAKRGVWDFGSGHESSFSSGGDFGGHDFGGLHKEEEHVKHVTIVKKVPVPYPVEVTKHVPVEVKVPYPVEVEKKVPVYVEKKVPVVVEKKVHVDRPVPYPVKVPVKVPVIGLNS